MTSPGGSSGLPIRYGSKMCKSASFLIARSISIATPHCTASESSCQLAVVGGERRRRPRRARALDVDAVVPLLRQLAQEAHRLRREAAPDLADEHEHVGGGVLSRRPARRSARLRGHVLERRCFLKAASAATSSSSATTSSSSTISSLFALCHGAGWGPRPARKVHRPRKTYPRARLSARLTAPRCSRSPSHPSLHHIVAPPLSCLDDSHSARVARPLLVS